MLKKDTSKNVHPRVYWVLIFLVIFFFFLSIVALFFYSAKWQKDLTKNNIQKLNLTKLEIDKQSKSEKIDTEKNEQSDISQEPELPVIDQEELKQTYSSNIKVFISELEEYINTEYSKDEISLDKIENYKESVMKEIVPKDYQELHLKIILMLDELASGEVIKAVKLIEEAKSSL